MTPILPNALPSEREDLLYKSTPDLKKKLEKNANQSLGITRIFIARGLGHHHWADTMKLAEAGDKDAVEYINLNSTHAAISDILSARFLGYEWAKRKVKET